MMTADDVSESIEYLASPRARESIAADPYWPKWDSPWWRMAALWELGLAASIPAIAVRAMVEALKTRYLPDMPFRAEDLPPGKDLYRDVACHCAVGVMHQVLFARGVAVDKELPWMREWLLRYQLPDGGLNCEGEAYVGSKKSSIVSTVPALEAILLDTPRPFTRAEEDFLDRGAGYLIAHKVFKSSADRVIDKDWSKLCFPRFYFYDVLRGLAFLVRWSRLRRKPLPSAAIGEAAAAVRSQIKDGSIVIGRQSFAGARSIHHQSDGSWKLGIARSFPLLERVSAVGQPSAELTTIWNEIAPETILTA